MRLAHDSLEGGVRAKLTTLSSAALPYPIIFLQRV